MSTNTNSKPRNNRSGNKSGQQRNRNNNNKRRGVPQRRKPAPKKLTFWQKFLKAIGLYKEAGNKKPETKKSQTPHNKSATKKATAKKTTKKRAPKQAPPQKVDSNRLYVGNLSYDVGENDLIDLFKGFGAVKNAEIIYNKRTQRSKGFAFVEMISVDDAKRSAEVLHEQPFMGRNLIVNGARTSEEEEKAVSSPAA